MTGCSVSKACTAVSAARVGSAPGICDAFQLLATICGREPAARQLAGCKAHYNGLCARGSAVRQCAQAPGLPLVSAAEANKWVSV